VSEPIISIVVVDDHPIFREGVARSLSEGIGFSVSGLGASADDAVRLAGEMAPDILLLDLSMPGGGLSALPKILERAPATKVVVLTASEDDDDVLKALRVGARGYVLKGVKSDTLIEILQGIQAGESYVSPSLAARILAEMRGLDSERQIEPSAQAEPDLLSTLTSREEQILGLVADGRSNKEVARLLDLQEKTIKHHMTHILHKLRVRNRTEAAMRLHEGRTRD
jgi:DNA-binding NarL/FixJ family response regulator